MANEIIKKEQEQGAVSVLKAQPSLLDIRKDPEKYPRLRSMDEAQAKLELGVVVMMAQQYRGQQIDEETTGTLVESLYTELMEDAENVGLSYLSMAEITRIVKRAVMGQTKRELFGINVASLLGVLTDYARGEGAALQEKVDNMNSVRLGIKYQQLTACAKVLAANMKV